MKLTSTEIRPTHIAETVRDSIDIPTTKLGFATTEMSKKCWQVITIATGNRKLRYEHRNSYNPLPGVGHTSVELCGQKPQICRSNFVSICHSSGDISISGFGGHIAISGHRSLLQ